MINNRKNIDKELIKITLISLILLLYTILMLCFSEMLFPYIVIFSGIVICAIPMLYLYVFLFSIRLIKNKPNYIFNWVPLIILIINVVIIFSLK